MTAKETAPLRVRVAGHTCLDLTVDLSNATLNPGSVLEVDPFRPRVGGCVANTGGALAMLGVSVDLEATIGTDLFGEMVERLLGDLGADSMSVHRDPHLATSCSIVLNPADADRSFLHHVGANASFDGAMTSVDDVDLLHIGYPQLLPELLRDGGRALTSLLERARERGVTTSLDFAAVETSSVAAASSMDLLRHWAPLVDVLSPSLDDLAAYFPRRACSSEIDKAADDLVELGVGIALVTDGGRGMALRTADSVRLSRGGRVLAGLPLEWANRQLRVPSAKTAVTRTSGAGDTATAGLLYGLTGLHSPERSLRVATVAAGLHCRGEDRLPDPSGDDVYSWLELTQCVFPGWREDDGNIHHGPYDGTPVRSQARAASSQSTKTTFSTELLDEVDVVDAPLHRPTHH